MTGHTMLRMKSVRAAFQCGCDTETTEGIQQVSADGRGEVAFLHPTTMYLD